MAKKKWFRKVGGIFAMPITWEGWLVLFSPLMLVLALTAIIEGLYAAGLIDDALWRYITPYVGVAISVPFIRHFGRSRVVDPEAERQDIDAFR